MGMDLTRPARVIETDTARTALIAGLAPLTDLSACLARVIKAAKAAAAICAFITRLALWTADEDLDIRA